MLLIVGQFTAVDGVWPLLPAKPARSCGVDRVRSWLPAPDPSQSCESDLAAPPPPPVCGPLVRRFRTVRGPAQTACSPRADVGP